MISKSLTVVFPMFNEEYYVRKTINETLRVIKSITDDYEIIIVDDASSDNSASIADDLSRQNNRIKVIHNKKNMKLGGSLKNGFNLASKNLVLYSDIDMPFELSEVEKAVNILLQESADLVCAYRLNRRIEGIKRYIYSVVYNIFIRFLFGLKVKDVNFSFKLIRNDILKQLNLASQGSFICAEMLIKARRRKAKIVQFGTLYQPRLHGLSRLSSLGDIFKIIQEAIVFRLMGQLVYYNEE